MSVHSLVRLWNIYFKLKAGTFMEAAWTIAASIEKKVSDEPVRQKMSMPPGMTVLT